MHRPWGAVACLAELGEQQQPVGLAQPLGQRGAKSCLLPLGWGCSTSEFLTQQELTQTLAREENKFSAFELHPVPGSGERPSFKSPGPGLWLGCWAISDLVVLFFFLSRWHHLGVSTNPTSGYSWCGDFVDWQDDTQLIRKTEGALAFAFAGTFDLNLEVLVRVKRPLGSQPEKTGLLEGGLGLAAHGSTRVMTY